MKYFFSLLFFNSFITLSYGQGCFFRVDFQDSFENDTVSFWINDKIIFENEVLSNLGNSGHTNLFLAFLLDSEDKHAYDIALMTFSPPAKYEVSHGINLRNLKKTNILTFKIKINDKIKSKEVDLLKGHFFGITTYDEDMRDGIFIHQRSSRFPYD